MTLMLYDPPTRNYYEKRGRVDDEFYQVYEKASAMILCFDVTDKSAFKKTIWTKSYLDEWREKKGDAPVIMVACKCDTNHDRMLFADVIQENSDALGLPVYETQAKTRVGVEECLEELARQLWPIHKK
eukprot:TRINITY_DN8104_c0_g1_i2.p1 TRINITY_DN8104_c0_g1~~TRINITY_DN8104_c0_g1_i2.p1  ORF type:complete len:128 (+),score=20.22 TRINITY_DN8104_c0_g1_i2:507-890(+)